MLPYPDPRLAEEDDDNVADAPFRDAEDAKVAEADDDEDAVGTRIFAPALGLLDRLADII